MPVCAVGGDVTDHRADPIEPGATVNDDADHDPVQPAGVTPLNAKLLDGHPAASVFVNATS